jgi:hypothetical protein
MRKRQIGKKFLIPGKLENKTCPSLLRKAPKLDNISRKEVLSVDQVSISIL